MLNIGLECLLNASYPAKQQGSIGATRYDATLLHYLGPRKLDQKAYALVCVEIAANGKFVARTAEGHKREG
ncbi:Uncharacterized protein HZ326_3321 [Fusarium oxysporum f. sp. albedinis]|jgi:hypothetical protein|nr:Uncharacterized protein HZ326_3321 [Fusarium oxysporum f. sp. albedinis]